MSLYKLHPINGLNPVRTLLYWGGGMRLPSSLSCLIKSKSIQSILNYLSLLTGVDMLGHNRESKRVYSLTSWITYTILSLSVKSSSVQGVVSGTRNKNRQGRKSGQKSQHGKNWPRWKIKGLTPQSYQTYDGWEEWQCFFITILLPQKTTTTRLKFTSSKFSYRPRQIQ